jgi:hypothetical protein
MEHYILTVKNILKFVFINVEKIELFVHGECAERQKSINIKSHRLIIKQHEENFRSYLPISLKRTGVLYSLHSYKLWLYVGKRMPPYPAASVNISWKS